MSQKWIKNSHCSYCGTPFAAPGTFPAQCGHCQQTTYLNPAPVAVVLQPVDDQLLVIRRTVEPRLGEMALPGGYIDANESWQQAAAREMYEETGLTIYPDQLALFDVASAPDGTLLVFALARPIQPKDLPAFRPTSETSELALIGKAAELGFPLHTQAVRAYFLRAVQGLR